MRTHPLDDQWREEFARLAVDVMRGTATQADRERLRELWTIVNPRGSIGDFIRHLEGRP